uniref:Uncharacterized protein n=1 Tax=Kuetzingia canaliculata TaxID=228262 RepID=A0A1Z1MPP2_KUECA|nr:hypothetical protein [Kuetzingia canaliculata]ARW67822.1 hypothetical protein [Kuetzingia canaliculata]
MNIEISFCLFTALLYKACIVFYVFTFYHVVPYYLFLFFLLLLCYIYTYQHKFSA